MCEFYDANVNYLTDEEKMLFLNLSIEENATIDGGKEFGIPHDIFQEKLKAFFVKQLYPTPNEEITLYWYGKYEGSNPRVYSFCYLHKLNENIYKLTSFTSIDKRRGNGKALIQHILLTYGKQKVFLFAFVPKQFEKALQFYRSLDTHSMAATDEEYPFPEHPAEWLGEYKDYIGKEKWICIWFPSGPAERLYDVFKNRLMEVEEYKEMVERRDVYKCISQQSLDENLVVGNDGKISLWPRGTVIRYGVDESSFPNKRYLRKAVIALDAAAKKWNKINFGVQFEYTKDKFQINFYMKYRTSVSSGDYAEAFFPTREISILYIHSALFTDDDLYIENILLHELGHILGLRHEFALDNGKKYEGDAVQFYLKNPNSVMSYRFPPKIQNTDKEGIKKLYQLNNGEIVEDFEVTFI